MDEARHPEATTKSPKSTSESSSESAKAAAWRPAPAEPRLVLT